MYLIKREWNNGDQDLLDIYHDTNKIKETQLFTNIIIDEETGEEKQVEKTSVTLWDATFDCPITIAKSRANDYEVSDELINVSRETIGGEYDK